MTCYSPVPAYQSGPGARVKLYPPLGTSNITLPCGSCLGCKTSHALDWARRCVHEAKGWTHNCFLTLTYSDEFLPEDGNLDPKALQLFLKRLRHFVEDPFASYMVNRDAHWGVRYFASGEYGEFGGRPHYHMLLFNCAFADSVRVGKDLFESATVSTLWPYGSHKLGTLTGASANYIAQYTIKKQGGAPCDEDGVYRVAPFVRMSRRPGIGSMWLEKYQEDLKHGALVYDGKAGRIPRAYRKVVARDNPALAGSIDVAVAQFHKPIDLVRLRVQGEIHKRLKTLTERRVL